MGHGVSNVIRYCRKHGPFKGFSWNAHQRFCKNKECTREEWMETVKGNKARKVKTRMPRKARKARKRRRMSCPNPVDALIKDFVGRMTRRLKRMVQSRVKQARSRIRRDQALIRRLNRAFRRDIKRLKKV